MMTNRRFTNISGTDTITVYYRSDLYPEWTYIELSPGQVTSVNGGQYVEYKIDPENAHNLRVDTYRD